ncbi:hypothetical protein HRbin36_01443 [bacterium HR36]|uniref:Uncharacterized protein n=1 Tax=uncultured Planctomycetota bacterium TaxID=120965 RepID=H5SLY6_9BACT|nr:hypothetical protein HGMM_F48A06C15 [uncultured Planctomycetota bacterium]GBD36322.1 hypothetical protein HRbin36_01443 [bacterium HR36]
MIRPTKPIARMTLQELLTQAQKCARDLSEHFHAGVFNALADFREVSRPVRKKSHFPTVQALKNSLDKLSEAAEETILLCDLLLELLTETLRRAKAELERQRV